MVHLLSDRVHGTIYYRCHTEALSGQGTGICHMGKGSQLLMGQYSCSGLS